MIKISASSLKLYRGCGRRWFFAKVLGHREPETASTNLGKETHAELEAFTRHSTVPKSALATKMLAAFQKYDLWPDPAVTEAEGAFTFTLDGVPFHGFTDTRRPGRHALHRVVGDYKTTGNLAFALRAEGGVLVDTDGNVDPQSSIYAAREYIEGATEVTGAWMYGLTKPPHTTRLVTVDFDQSKVEAEMRKAVAHGKQMVRLSVLRPDVNEVPYNSGYCFAYKKPCPFTDSCVRGQGGLFSAPSPLDLCHATDGDQVMSNFLDSIRTSFPGTATPDAPPPPPPEDDAPPPPPPPEDDAPPPPVEEPHVAEVIAAAAVDAPATRDVMESVESGFINPPESAGKAPYATPEEAAAGEGVQAPKAKKSAKKNKAGMPVDSKGFTVTKDTRFDSGTGEPLTLESFVDTVAEVVETKGPTAEQLLRRMFDLLKAHFEG